MFRLKKNEMVGGWRKMPYEELRNLYSSPSMNRMIKSRMIKWTGYLDRVGKIGMHIGFL
jgi:hypothetical protein